MDAQLCRVIYEKDDVCVFFILYALYDTFYGR